MKHIREIIPAAIAAIKFRVAQYQLRRETARKNTIVQFWQAGSLGGAANIQLGDMTRAAALKVVADLKEGPIVYIDDERGFIAFGNPPQAPGSNV